MNGDDSAPAGVPDDSLIDLVALGRFIWNLKWAVALSAAAGLLAALDAECPGLGLARDVGG